MKYIITENKLNDIIFKFLDFNYGALEQKTGTRSDIIFTFPGKKSGVLGWKKSGDLSVYYDLSDEVSNYFGFDNDDSLKIIGKWVEDRHNLKVINTENEIAAYLTFIKDI
jgi:hypothetical protein